jgi:hypothetical protein
MTRFNRANLPEPLSYYEAAGLRLQGRGTWRTTLCEFHGSRSTMRINILTGAFVCMAGCGAKGGDVVDYHRAAHGLGFIDAAKALGAWLDDGVAYTGPTRPTPIPARDLLQLAADELLICVMVLADALAGRMKDHDFDRLRVAVGRVIFVNEAANARR